MSDLHLPKQTIPSEVFPSVRAEWLRIAAKLRSQGVAESDLREAVAVELERVEARSGVWTLFQGVKS